MRNHGLTLLAVVLAATLLAETSLATETGNEAGFKTAVAAAEAANKEAGALKNQWTTTADTLAAAKRTAEAHNYDLAIELAKHAEALAKASIYQAKEQEEAWKAAVIR